jgi:hypothetical protein
MRAFWIGTALLWAALSANAQQVAEEPPAAEAPAAEAPAASWREEIALHGFGSWRYGKSSNENVYLQADEDGNYRASDFTLNLSADITQRLRVVAQVGFSEGLEGSEQDLDYVFAEWKLSSRTRLRLGQVKMPFGIYGEVPDVGTLRPMIELPQVAYGPIGFLGNAYKGVGIDGSFGGRWRTRWDVYGGGTDLDEDVVAEAYLLGAPVGSEDRIENEVTRDVLGGHLVVETPLEGLSFGGSLLTGTETGGGSARRTVYGLQAEYAGEALTVRAEHMHEDVHQDLGASGSYLEVSYRLTPHWQAAAEVGRLRTTFFGVHPVGTASQLTWHDEAVLGLNYWLDPNLVLKLNFQRIRGNAYAHPNAEDLPAAVAAGALRRHTDVLLAGAQFTF